jgi:formate dehydrogenase major subunit
MAECHPVGFQWVMEAKARGAKLIHVDPRFTRTSTLADLHVPLRAGSDIAFLGGIINYVLSSEKYFREYVLAYTNAAVILTEEFKDTEDLDGVFSGLDRENRSYDFHTWQYQGLEVQAASGERDKEYGDRAASAREAGRGEAHGSGGPALPAGTPERDDTLQHPRCVFQVLKRHFARYSPEMVEQVCGVPQDTFRRVCELLTENSGRERTSAFVYSVGWTQHTVGVQYIRTASILQTLLGNIGRPGGGILALRGHASIQGSTDIPTLFNLLPGYLPMPHAHSHQDLGTYAEAEAARKGYWANMRAYTVSLLKAWWGPAARQENDFCFDYLPRLTGSHGTYETVMAQLAGTCYGYFLYGENPAVGSANARLQRLGMAKLDWLVVRDFSLIESATWWKDGPEIETGELRTENIGTEVFFLPAAAHTEKDGSFTNTQRMLQWHHQAVEPPGDARSDLWFTYHLGRKIREKLADPDIGQQEAADIARHLGHCAAEMDQPILDLTWDYPVKGETAEPDAEAVLAEINGWDARGRPAAFKHPDNRMQPSGDDPGSEVFPYVATTYRLTEHHTAGGMSRSLPYLAELQPEFFCEVSPRLAAERGLEHLGWATIASARNVIEARVLVTERMKTLTVQGRRLEQVGLPYHWGPNGYSTGDAANELTAVSLDPNVHIQEVKAFACDIQPGRRPRGAGRAGLVRDYQRRAGITEETGMAP